MSHAGFTATVSPGMPCPPDQGGCAPPMIHIGGGHCVMPGRDCGATGGAGQEAGLFSIFKKVARTATSFIPLVGPTISELIPRDRKAEQAIQRTVARQRPTSSRSLSTRFRTALQPQGCPPLMVMTPQGCRDLTPNITTPAERSIGVRSQVVPGAFGMPAATPEIQTRTHRQCPSGMVLGKDLLCYPKAVLRRDSRFRRWRPGAKPVLTGGQRRGISKARTAVTDAKEAISGLGVTVKKK